MNEHRTGLGLLTVFLCGVIGMSECNGDYVVLLHGLARSARSMRPLQRRLDAAGFQVINLAYPSRRHSLEHLAELVRAEVVAKLPEGEGTPVHMVTHSMGGIVLRQIQNDDPLPGLRRVVMLSPPNQGSEVSDGLRDWPLVRRLFGPAFRQLGTDSETGPSRYGPVDFELGVITGDRSINWINSFLFISGPDDGKVSLDAAKVEGMCDYRVVHVTHPFIMRKPEVMRLTVRFLQTGGFAAPK